jgi:hypothetical protein
MSTRVFRPLAGRGVVHRRDGHPHEGVREVGEVGGGPAVQGVVSCAAEVLVGVRLALEDIVAAQPFLASLAPPQMTSSPSVPRIVSPLEVPVMVQSVGL